MHACGRANAISTARPEIAGHILKMAAHPFMTAHAKTANYKVIPSEQLSMTAIFDRKTITRCIYISNKD